MKKFFITLGICITFGILVMSILNMTNIKPLDFYGNDPNSNAMIFGIVYLIIGGVILGIGISTGSLNLSEQVQYLKKGYLDDAQQQDNRFPAAIAIFLSGVLFIILYLILNRLTIK